MTTLFLALALVLNDPATFSLTSEKQLIDPETRSEIESFYVQGRSGSFTGREGVAIHYNLFRREVPGGPAIVISSGRTEAAVKYKELIYDLFHNGYSVYIHDHRGQGLSGRMAADPDMGYIDEFRYYVDDLKTFYDQFVEPGGHDKIFLLAHSMGGAIGMSYLQEHPEDFHAAAFSSPMLGLPSPTCLVAGLLSPGKPRYGPGQSGYDREKYPFENNSVTGSRIRYERALDAFDQVPEARLGGASIQWVHRSCRQIRQIFRQAERIETPFILFSALDETVVDPGSHAAFIRKARKLGKDCSLVYVEDARHELLMEKDTPRMQAISRTLEFYSRY